MKSKNGQLIKDSQYLTLWSQTICKKKYLSTAVECLVMCCLISDNWARELVHCGHLYVFSPVRLRIWVFRVNAWLNNYLGNLSFTF